ncbi:MAG: 50S ribosomal protein L21 [Acidobacteriota bacterium]
MIQTGGKQYRVNPGSLIHVERLEGEVGGKIGFDEVLFVSDEQESRVGDPTVQGARVVGTIVEQGKGSKVLVFKFKRRKMYRRKAGHRQLFTAVKIDEIEVGKPQREEKKPVTAPESGAEKKASEPESGTHAATSVKKAGAKKAVVKKATPPKAAAPAAKARTRKDTGKAGKKSPSRKRKPTEPDSPPVEGK